jgi:hypothetical protein
MAMRDCDTPEAVMAYLDRRADTEVLAALSTVDCPPRLADILPPPLMEDDFSFAFSAATTTASIIGLPMLVPIPEPALAMASPSWIQQMETGFSSAFEAVSEAASTTTGRIATRIGIAVISRIPYIGPVVSTVIVPVVSAVNAGLSLFELYEGARNSNETIERPSAEKGSHGGGGSSMMPDGGPDDHEPRNARRADTQEGRDNFVRDNVNRGAWQKLRGTRSGRPTWRNREGTEYYQKTNEGWEIEVYNSYGEHIGIIKPSDGVLRTSERVASRSINLH